MTVQYVGVRHHSPACARVVAHTIRERQPAWVLIEGPVDLNPRLDELRLDHELPIAIYSYLHGEGIHHSSWTPLCEYSPEWQAIRVGDEVGAEVRFIDLPAWHRSFGDYSNRYRDGADRYAEAIATLCVELRVDGLDSLWDHLFERDEPTEVIAERLATYFDELRDPKHPVSDGEAEREQYMAQCVAAAAADGSDVVVVTGGFHTTAIRELAKTAATEWPAVPEPDGATRFESYLVPFGFRRLDAFTGYQSGMPSPEWYQLLWESNPTEAPERMLRRVIAELREANVSVSAADLIAVQTMTEGLARLRGHATPTRSDVLDGLASALLKDAQHVPFPWTRRGSILAGTDPAVVVMAKTLSGSRMGRLAPETPLPPLVADVERQLAEPRLTRSFEDASPLELRLTTEGDLATSRVLHRLRVLSIPGFARTAGTDASRIVELDETWILSRPDGQLPGLIEAAAYGATLERAAASKVAEELHEVGSDTAALATVLAKAVLVGVASLTDEVLDAARQAIAAATHLGELANLLATAVSLHRHDTVLETAGNETLGGIIHAAWTRMLWLLEVTTGATDPAGIVDAIRALATAAQSGVTPPLPVDAATGTMRRLVVRREVAPELHGAAVGWLWAIASSGISPEQARAETATALAAANRPDLIGDWLSGLFALARDQVVADDLASAGAVDTADRLGSAHAGNTDANPSILELIDATVAAMDADQYLVALPSLRMAFSWFPPTEREQIGERILGRRGVKTLGRAIPKLSTDPIGVASGAALDEQVTQVLARYRLGRPTGSTE